MAIAESAKESEDERFIAAAMRSALGRGTRSGIHPGKDCAEKEIVKHELITDLAEYQRGCNGDSERR